MPSESVDEFSASRLVLARKRRALTKKGLAASSGVAIRSITAYERGESCPSIHKLESIVRALRFPLSFFLQDEVDAVSLESVNFRKLARVSAAQRDSALMTGTLAREFWRWIETRLTLPRVDVPELCGWPAAAAAAETRAAWSLSEAPIRNVLHQVEARGIRVLSLDHKNGDIDAFSFWSDGTPIVLLNLGKSVERARFDAAHELAHMVLHRRRLTQDRRKVERQADEFASAFLMPEGAVKKAVSNVAIDLASIHRLKRIWGVSAMALVHRLRGLDLVSEWRSRALYKAVSCEGGRRREKGGLPSETSLLLAKVFAALRDDGLSRYDVAKELHLRTPDLDALVAGLVLTPVAR